MSDTVREALVAARVTLSKAFVLLEQINPAVSNEADDCADACDAALAELDAREVDVLVADADVCVGRFMDNLYAAKDCSCSSPHSRIRVTRLPDKHKQLAEEGKR